MIGKSKAFDEHFPKTLRRNKISVTDKNVISDKFNKFLISELANLPPKVLSSNKDFN